MFFRILENFSFAQFCDFGSIFGGPGIRLEILVRFWWEWYFWKWHSPRFTQIVDFFLYHVYCSVNLKKHLLHKISSLRGKLTKICWFLLHFGETGAGAWIKVQFWWEWHFWKCPSPRFTRIFDFFICHVYWSSNLTKHLLLTIVNFRGKMTKIFLFLLNFWKTSAGAWINVQFG